MSFNIREANQLVAFFRKKGFTRSSEVSHYITTHNLQKRWPHITGHVTMEHENGRHIWDYDGGISPECYAYVCRQLRLGNQGTCSSVIGFTSYDDKEKTRSRRKRRYGRRG